MSNIPITSNDLKQYDTAIKRYIQQELEKAISSSQLSGSTSNSIPSTSLTPATPTIRPETINVQEDVQEDYIIFDRVITPNAQIKYRNVVVTGDDRSNRIFFNMWRTFDDREMLDKTISIIWKNANGEKGESLAVDKCIKDGNRLVFAWDVPAQATYKEGLIHYAIRITDDDYAWNTLSATIECVKGLMSDNYNNLEEAKLAPGWVDFIEGKYNVGVQRVTVSDYANLINKQPDILYLVYDEANGTVTPYLGNIRCV